MQTRAAAAAARPSGGWRRVEEEDDFTPPHEFSVRTPGPRQLPPRNSNPVDYFLLLYTVATMRTVLQNTREYATQVFGDMAGWIARHPSSRMRRWSLGDVTLELLKRYIGLCINMGLIRKKNVEDYWSKKNPSQATPYFAFVMPFRKFAMMQRFLHVGPLVTPAHGQDGFDPWSKVRPVLDVQAVLCRPAARLDRFGIKKFELCDSTYFMWSCMREKISRYTVTSGRPMVS